MIISGNAHSRYLVVEEMNDTVSKLVDKESMLESVKNTEAMYPYKVPGDYDTYNQYNEGWSDACDYIRGELETLTAADVETIVHAKWLHIDGNKYKCSHCRAITEVDEVMGEPIYNGCPYCRAAMDLE